MSIHWRRMMRISEDSFLLTLLLGLELTIPPVIGRMVQLPSWRPKPVPASFPLFLFTHPPSF